MLPVNDLCKHCFMVMPEIPFCKSPFCSELGFMLFLLLSHFQIYVISLAEPRLPLQLDDAVRAEVEGEEVKTFCP